MNDARLEKNLTYLKDVMPTANAIIKATKEKDRNKSMFSKDTIERYTKDRENSEEEMEI